MKNIIIFILSSPLLVACLVLNLCCLVMVMLCAPFFFLLTLIEWIKGKDADVLNFMWDFATYPMQMYFEIYR